MPSILISLAALAALREKEKTLLKTISRKDTKNTKNTPDRFRSFPHAICNRQEKLRGPVGISFAMLFSNLHNDKFAIEVHAQNAAGQGAVAKRS
ncbi:MAG: hypothetical protein WCK47_11130, partial [bacterium]